MSVNMQLQQMKAFNTEVLPGEFFSKWENIIYLKSAPDRFCILGIERSSTWVNIMHQSSKGSVILELYTHKRLLFSLANHWI